MNNISNEYNINIIRIYGVAGHGKNEVDTVGGVSKIAIRNAVSCGQAFFNATECVNYLQETFSANDYPYYHFKLIVPKYLDTLRHEAKYVVCPTIKGSSKFQIIIFEANTDINKVAPYLCSCYECINTKYGSCSLFRTHILESGVLNEISLHSNYHAVNQDEELSNKADDPLDKSLIANNTLCAIVADHNSADTVWFVLILDSDCCDENNPVTDAYGHTVPTGQLYNQCYYLEKHNELRKGVVYKVNKKNGYIYKESIVYPVVNMEVNHNGVADSYYFKNSEYVEILYYVEHTGMESIF